MEKVSAETINEVLTMHPDITVIEFISKLKEKWTEHINQIFDREISVVLIEYRAAIKKVIEEAKQLEENN